MGVRVIKGIKHPKFPPEDYLDAACVDNVYYDLGGFCCLPLSFLRGVKREARYETVVINSPVYCAYLLRTFVLQVVR